MHSSTRFELHRDVRDALYECFKRYVLTKVMSRGWTCTVVSYPGGMIQKMTNTDLVVRIGIIG